MPAINVYVSEQLKADMDSVNQSVNWSATCQGAIEREVARIKAATGDQESVLERVLRTGSKQYDDGYEVGAAFAREHADIDDFEAFENFDDRVQRIEAHNMTDEAAERLAFLEIAEEVEVDDPGYCCGRGWERRSTRWLRGFAKAMNDVWAPIKDKASQI